MSERLALHMLHTQLLLVQEQLNKRQYDRERLPLLDLITNEQLHQRNVVGPPAGGGMGGTTSPVDHFSCVECQSKALNIMQLQDQIESLQTQVALREDGLALYQGEEEDRASTQDSFGQLTITQDTDVVQQVTTQQRLRVECAVLETRLRETHEMHRLDLRRTHTYFESLLSKLHFLTVNTSFDMLVALLFQRLSYQSTTSSTLLAQPLLALPRNEESTAVATVVLSQGGDSHIVHEPSSVIQIVSSNTLWPANGPQVVVNKETPSSNKESSSISTELVRRYGLMAFQHAEATGRALLERDAFVQWSRLLQDRAHQLALTVNRNASTYASTTTTTAQQRHMPQVEEYTLLKREYDHRRRVKSLSSSPTRNWSH